MLYATNAGLLKDEVEIAKSMGVQDIVISDNRNDGIIAVSEEGRENHHDWSEGDVVIDLDDERIYFGIDFLVAENVKDFRHYLIDSCGYEREERDEILKNLPTIEGGLDHEFTFQEWDKFCTDMYTRVSDKSFYYRTKDGIWEIVE